MITSGTIKFTDGNPAKQYLVELWDSDLGPDDFVANTFTDKSGRFSMEHARNQDPAISGSNKRKGDFYVKIFKPGRILNGVALPPYSFVGRSATYDDYGNQDLIINLSFDAILQTHPVNTVYGTVTGLFPDGTERPLVDHLVKIVDEDLTWDDRLGTVTTDEDGQYLLSFSRRDWDKPGEIEHRGPDLLVSVYKKISREWRSIWRHKKLGDSFLPRRVDVSVPVVTVRGKVGSYSQCSNGRMVQKNPDDLVARAWDHDGVFGKDFLGQSMVSTEGHFEIDIFGSRDHPYNWKDGNDILIALRDKTTDEIAWQSPVHANVLEPQIITLNEGNEIEASIACPEIEVDEPQRGDAGTTVRITNLLSEVRHIYRDGRYLTSLGVRGSANSNTDLHVDCDAISRIQAKSEISNSFNPVTKELDVRGACQTTPLVFTWHIDN